MPEILPPESDEIAPRSRWESAKWKAARPFVFGLSLAGCFAFVLWGTNQFLSLRGVVHVAASRVVLSMTWVAACLCCLFATRFVTKRRNLCLALCVVIVTALAFGFDWWAPKPIPASRAVPLITLKISPSVFPISAAPHSTLFLLPLHPYQTFDTTSELHTFSNPCGEDHFWPSEEEINSKAKNAYEEVRELDVVNHSPVTMEAGKAVFRLSYNDSFGGGCTPPKNPTYQYDVVSISALDPGRTFQFFSVNQTNRCVWLSPPETMSA